MKDVKDAIKLLKDEGYSIPKNIVRYYNNTDHWRKWWEGYVPSFHLHQVTGANNELQTLKRYTLGMAKTVAEDWANLLLNDKTYVDVGDEATQKYLSGDKELQEGGLFDKVEFWTMENENAENTYATGTTCTVIGIKNATGIEKDDLLEVTGGEITYRYIDDPKCIIPISWNKKGITDCALLDVYFEKGSKLMHLQIHELIKDSSEYKITNFLYEYINSKWTKIKYDGAASYRSPAKMFHILKTNLSNNIDKNVPFGISIYANATDQLKGIDLAVDNLGMDFYLGRKKVFMNQDLMTTFEDSEGKKRVAVGDTLEQTLFVSAGKKLPGDKQEYHEYNPALRVSDNKEGIQTHLDLLSLKVGMGTRRYSFENGTVYTNVTQTKNSNKDLVESVNKQRITVNSFLKGLIRNTLIIAKSLGEQVNPNTSIIVRFDDSAFTDEEAERLRFLQEIREGVRQRWEYRVKYLGEEEKDAKGMVADDISGLTYDQ